MKLKKILLLAPTLLLVSPLVACNGSGTDPKPTPPTPPTPVKLTATLSTSPVLVGYTLNDIGLNVLVSYSDSSIKTITEGYTTNPEGTYMFKKEDVSNGKDITVSYNGLNSTIHADVKDPQYASYLNFELVGENVSVSLKEGSTKTKARIPATVEGSYVTNGKVGTKYKVTEVKANGFKGNTSLETVYFNDPSYVETINEGSFSNCSSLKSIIIPTSAKKIMKNVFLGCTNLTSVTFNKTDGWVCENQTIDVSAPTTNATNLKDENSLWCSKGISRN